MLLGDRLNGLVNGEQLVVAGRLVATIAVVVLRNQRLLLSGKPLVLCPPLPQRIGAGKLIQAKLAFDDATLGDLVVEQEAITIAAEHERHLQHFGVAKGLLHARADGVLVVLCLDDSDGKIGLVEQDVVGPFVLASCVQFAANNDAPLGQEEFFPYLSQDVPSSLHQSRGDEFGADVAFAERLLIHLFHVGFPRAADCCSTFALVALRRWRPLRPRQSIQHDHKFSRQGGRLNVPNIALQRNQPVIRHQPQRAGQVRHLAAAEFSQFRQGFGLLVMD